MKIGIATTGRFHVLDLARELHSLGHDVLFYSYVPVKRAVQFGLPASCQRSMFCWLFPLLVLNRWCPKHFSKFLDRWNILLMDRLVEWDLKKCDVFIGMSGLFLRAPQKARKKYGAHILVERGSAHVSWQKEILENIKEAPAKVDMPDEFLVRRELSSYRLADVIVVPSKFAESTFDRYGINREMVFRNPYGVDLEIFPSALVISAQEPTIIFVGLWSYQKGCDLLAKVLDRLEAVTLIHVGAIGDAPLPGSKRFIHYDHVDQRELHQYYALAHVFVLASRQEGLALVLPQALACGLPVVATDRSGGPDILDLVGDKNWVRIVRTEELDELCDGILRSLEYARNTQRPRALPDEIRNKLSWKDYGKRYSDKLHALFPG